jgi:cell wall-associated NlpC family hydrolase
MEAISADIRFISAGKRRGFCRLRRRARAVFLAAVTALVAACGTLPPRPVATPATPSAAAGGTQPGAQSDPGTAIVRIAASLIGTRYQFGGADEAGFDCSGLVLYVHERVGLRVPRTAAAQQHAALPVPLAQLVPGDLVFFSSGRHGVDHVGIYAGFGRFIHAPHAGVAVSYAELTSGYYASHLVSAGRFW